MPADDHRLPNDQEMIMRHSTLAIFAAALLSSTAASAGSYHADVQRDVTLASLSAPEGTGHVDIAQARPEGTGHVDIAQARPEGTGHVDIAGIPPEGYTAPEGTATA